MAFPRGRGDKKRLGRAVFLAVLALRAGAAPASASGAIGAPGVGDPYFPQAGNGGIDVRDYSLRLAYDPATRRLEGLARLSGVATAHLGASTSTCAASRSAR